MRSTLVDIPTFGNDRLYLKFGNVRLTFYIWKGACTVLQSVLLRKAFLVQSQRLWRALRPRAKECRIVHCTVSAIPTALGFGNKTETHAALQREALLH